MVAGSGYAANPTTGVPISPLDAAGCKHGPIGPDGGSDDPKGETWIT